jgi:PatG C-terminal
MQLSRWSLSEVILSFTQRNPDVTEKTFMRVDVTAEFPFLVTKMSPYQDVPLLRSLNVCDGKGDRDDNDDSGIFGGGIVRRNNRRVLNKRRRRGARSVRCSGPSAVGSGGRLVLQSIPAAAVLRIRAPFRASVHLSVLESDRVLHLPNGLSRSSDLSVPSAGPDAGYHLTMARKPSSVSGQWDQSP